MEGNFIHKINELEGLDPNFEKSHGNRVFYVIIHCIPIPILLKATQSESLIMPISIPLSSPLKDIFGMINQYFDETLDQMGLYFIKNSSKLILSDKNHRVFECTDEAVFQKIFRYPYTLPEQIEQGKINFHEELSFLTKVNQERKDLNYDEILLDPGRSGSQIAQSNCVRPVDSETLIKNVEKPYLFITVKNYANRLQGKEQEKEKFRQIIQEGIIQGAQTLTDPRERLESLQFIDSEFPL